MSFFNKVFVHLVWATVRRRRLLNLPVRHVLLPYLMTKAVEAMHVHVAMRLANATALSRAVQEM